MKNTLIKILGLLAMAIPLTMQAQSSFLDNCTTFDSSLWNIDDWALGKGSVLTADFAPSGGGVYNFELPANTWNGAELTSKASYSYGTLEAQIKCPNVSGNDNALFFYNSAVDAVDLEIIKDGPTWEVACSVWIGGTMTWQHIYYPTFDPTSGYYDYAIDYTANSVGFYINGNLECECTTASDIPTATMPIEMNSWWPTWLSTSQPTGNNYMQVNWISFTSN